jgi:hypothetical protein
MGSDEVARLAADLDGGAVLEIAEVLRLGPGEEGVMREDYVTEAVAGTQVSSETEEVADSARRAEDAGSRGATEVSEETVEDEGRQVTARREDMVGLYGY